jgi:hypothetical protein
VPPAKGKASSHNVGRWKDDSGYVITDVDLGFVAITRADLAALGDKQRPLDLSEDAYAAFTTTLRDALTQCGATDADVRLQGSAAFLFSGLHKTLPQTRDDVFALMYERMRHSPDDFAVTKALSRLHALWPPGTTAPRRPFFDLLHELRIDPVPSDIDVQVSSAALLARAAQIARTSGVSVAALQVDDPYYGFLKPKVVDKIAYPLLHWADDMSAQLFRVVAVKVFGGSGPPNVSGKPGTVMSSHFQKRDWVVWRSGQVAKP